MALGKRIILFFLTNFLVITTFSIFFHLFGISSYTADYGLNLTGLAIICFCYGMASSFFSLLISRAVAKWSMGISLIDSSNPNPQMRELVHVVDDLSRKAGLPKMPEVGVYDSDDINAFATGPTKSRALVAVSTGLLRSMDRNEIEAVLAHEISHVANGDMVTMTLLQGIVNAFSMFFARIIAYVLTRGRDDEQGSGFLGTLAYYAIYYVSQTVFLMLGAIVVSAFSRHREYRADEGSARMVGKEKMISALDTLRRNYEQMNAKQGTFATMMISNKPQSLFDKLYSSHPSLDNRIEKLQTS